MIFHGGTNPRPVLFADSATLTSKHFNVESLLVITGSNKTLTLPTPNRDISGKPSYIVNNSATSATIAGSLVTGSSDTLLTKDTVICVCLPVSATSYKWHLLGLSAATAGLQEVVEDYCAGLFSAGVTTGAGLTYDDAGGHIDVAVTYGAVGKIAAIGATTSSASAGVENSASRSDHVHNMISHDHSGSTVGGTIAHTALTSIGTHTHDQIDSHIDATGSTVHGLGTISTQAANAVAITGGSVTGITDLAVADGGTGASSLTDHSILCGSGTSAVTALTAATNGQLPIGSTGADPTVATLTEGDGIDITNGAGSITIGVDLKTNGGIVIETAEMALDLGASAITGTLAVGDGGTGATTLGDHGILIGNATAAVTSLGEATNGQIPIGVTGAVPTLATISGSEGVTVTSGAGSIALKVTDNGVDFAKIAHGASRGIMHYSGATFDPALLAAPTSGYVLKGAGATSDLAFGLVGLDSVSNGSAWAAWTPVLTWLTGAAPASVTTVARWMRRWNTVEFDFDSYGADGDARVLHGFTLPVATAATASKPFTAFQVVNTTPSAVFAHLLTATEVALDSTVGDVLTSTLVADGDFGAATGWTTGTGWSIGTGIATKTTGDATALQQDTWQPVIGCKYRLTFTTASVTTPGTLAVSCGGVTLTPRTTADTFKEDFIATATDKLLFTADATWAGTMDNVIVTQLNRGGTGTEAGVKFRTAVTCTDSVAWRVRVSGSYEVA